MYRVKSKEELISKANRRSDDMNGFVFGSNSMYKALEFADHMFKYCEQKCEIIPLDQVEKIKPWPFNETNYRDNNWCRIDWLEEINDEEINDINIEELI